MQAGKGAIKTSPQEMAQIELLHMLKETNSTPLHLFDDIMQWAHRWSGENAFHDSNQSNSQVQVLKKFQGKIDSMPPFGETLVQ